MNRFLIKLKKMLMLERILEEKMMMKSDSKKCLYTY